MSLKLGEINAFVKNLLNHHPDRILIRSHHIEKERVWREIDTQDVRKVLMSGHCSQVRKNDAAIIWIGFDESSRKIELIGSLVDDEGGKTLFIKEAYSFRVGTAYDPRTNDEDLLSAWLIVNPEYELIDEVKKIVKRKG